MTHEQHLTTIAEFMGWDTDIVQDRVVVFFIGKNCYDTKSFDTMRMVFDEWRNRCKHLADCDFRKYVELLQNIERALCSGTPSDCAARLAEAIEWWKSVK